MRSRTASPPPSCARSFATAHPIDTSRFALPCAEQHVQQHPSAPTALDSAWVTDPPFNMKSRMCVLSPTLDALDSSSHWRACHLVDSLNDLLGLYDGGCLQLKRVGRRHILRAQADHLRAARPAQCE